MTCCVAQKKRVSPRVPNLELLSLSRCKGREVRSAHTPSKPSNPPGGIPAKGGTFLG